MIGLFLYTLPQYIFHAGMRTTIPAYVAYRFESKAIARAHSPYQGADTGTGAALEEGQDCAVVLQQLAAVRGAVNGLMLELLEGHVREHLGAEAATAEQREQDLELVVKVLRSYVK
jgi:DNA-binding FrmR family transcriptional regulator